MEKSEKPRSTADPECVLELEGTELSLGDLGPDGHQLRPHIVWFGEEVPAFGQATKIMDAADLVLVVGTSLQVYPAAGLVGLAPDGVPIVVVDPIRPSKEGDAWKCCQSGPWKGSRCWRRDGPQRTRRRQAPTFDVSSN